jgi:hypothetical protein
VFSSAIHLHLSAGVKRHFPDGRNVAGRRNLQRNRRYRYDNTPILRSTENYDRILGITKNTVTRKL